MLSLARRVTVAASLLVAITATCRADTISLTLVGGPTPVAGGFEYTYAVTVSLAQLHPTDYFVLYDFVGYVAGSLDASVLGPAWVASVTLDGPTPFNQAHVDNPAISDFVLTYVGAPTGDFITFFPGIFKAVSIYGGTGDLTYSAQDHKASFIGDPSDQQGNTSTVDGPVVPLPATAWAGMGLFGLLGGAGGFKKLRQRKEDMVD
jgi:hypothetical protein